MAYSSSSSSSRRARNTASLPSSSSSRRSRNTAPLPNLQVPQTGQPGNACLCSGTRTAQPSTIRNVIREISELLAGAEDAASPSNQDATDCGRHPNEDDFMECALGFLAYLHDHPNRRRRGGRSHQGVPDLTYSSYGSSSGRSGPSTGSPLMHHRSIPSSSDPDSRSTSSRSTGSRSTGSRSTGSSPSAGGQAGGPQTTITELFQVRRGQAVSPLSLGSGGSDYQGGISDHSAPVSPMSLSPPPSTWGGNRSRAPSPEQRRPSEQQTTWSGNWSSVPSPEHRPSRAAQEG
ncbi:hypothetical protein ACEPAI_3409 [Sanghuangporus weigelae]